MINYTSKGCSPSSKKTLSLVKREDIPLSTNTTTCNNVINNRFYTKANKLRLDSLYKEAIKNYLNAILIDRKNANSYYGLGVCYKHLKEYAKAIKYLDIAAELDETNYEIFYELGICHLMEGIPCGAIKNFIKAIQLDPDNPEAILQLGIAHELCEEYDLALMIYQKLIENSAGFLKAYEHKATLLMKMERYKEAAQILHELIKLNPDYNKAYAGLGICLDKLGQSASAQRYYRRFLTKKPFSHSAGFISNRLDKIKNYKVQKSYLKLCK